MELLYSIYWNIIYEFFPQIILVLVGWGMGIGGTILYDSYNNHKKKKEIYIALQTELKELKYVKLNILGKK